MFLKVLQEVCHCRVTLKVIEVVVDPEQHYSRYLWDTMRVLFSGATETRTSSHTVAVTSYFHCTIWVRAALTRNLLRALAEYTVGVGSEVLFNYFAGPWELIVVSGPAKCLTTWVQTSFLTVLPRCRKPKLISHLYIMVKITCKLLQNTDCSNKTHP